MPKERKVEQIVAYTDGGSRSSCDLAGIGVVIKTTPPVKISRFFRKITNNVSEYRALLEALTWAVDHGVRNFHVNSDSEVMVRHIIGEYTCKAPTLLPLLAKTRLLIAKIPCFSISHIPRELNFEADELANAAMNAQKDSITK